MNKLFLPALFMLAAVSSCSDAPRVQTEKEILNQYCKSSLKTNYYDALDEVLPDSIFKGKDIIACGQSTHGSRENFQVQAELFKYLAKNKGCRTFIIEGNYASVSTVNFYITTGLAKKEDVMSSLGFWIWDTEEVWDLIEWMREFNKTVTNDQPILFLGNDMQGIPSCAKGALGFFLRFGGPYMDSATQILLPLVTDTSKVFTQTNSEGDPGFTTELAKLEAWAEKAEIPAGESAYEAFRLSKYAITVFRQSLELHNAKPAAASAIRDRTMAENVRSIDQMGLRQGPIYIWAHNYHIANVDKYGGRMGTFLKEWYGDQYLSIAVDFSDGGSFNARTPVADSAGPMIQFSAMSKPMVCLMEPDTNCLGYKCGQKESGLTFCNVSAAAKDGAFRATTVFQQARMHTIGAMFDSVADIAEPVFYLGGVDLSRDYDGILFYGQSTPTQLLNTPKEKARQH